MFERGGGVPTLSNWGEALFGDFSLASKVFAWGGGGEFLVFAWGREFLVGLSARRDVCPPLIIGSNPAV